MSEPLEVLHEIQELDSETDRLRRALEGLDSGEELRARVAALETEVGALRAERRGMESQQLDRELEMKTLEEKKKVEENRLYSGRIGNPKALADLQREVEMLDREIDRLSDVVLQMMENLESHAKALAEKEGLLAQEKEMLAQVESKFATTSTRLKAELQELKARRAEAAAKVAPSLLRRYDSIRARQAGIGLVKVMEPICPGCHVSIPSEVVKLLKTNSSPQTCESCGRLFYYERKQGN